MSFHPTGPALERFARGENPPEELHAVLRHLITGCRFCCRRLAPWMELALAAETVPASEKTLSQSETEIYEGPVRRALAAAKQQALQLEHERGQLEEALAVARSLSWSSLGLLPDLCRRLSGLSQTVQVEVFLLLTREERYRDPRKMERYAELATFCALALDSSHPDSLQADLQARAYGERANAFRILERFGEARESIGRAFRCHSEGSEDPLIQAELFLVQAALECAQRKFSEAIGYLHQAKKIYQDFGDRHLEGRVLISEGLYMNYWGYPEEALILVQKGRGQLEPERDPQLTVTADETLLLLLVECDLYKEAAQLLLRRGLRRAFADQPLNLAKLRWVEGKVLRGLGKLDRAERAFEEARAAFISTNHLFRAALVGLDLAEIWLQRGKKAEVRELALQIRDVFEDLGIGREACIAVTFLQQATELAPAPAPQWALHVGRFLQRLEREPHLRFAFPDGLPPVLA